MHAVRTLTAGEEENDHNLYRAMEFESSIFSVRSAVRSLRIPAPPGQVLFRCIHR